MQIHPVTFSSSARDTHNVICPFAMYDPDHIGIAGFDTEGLSQVRKTKRQQAPAERESQDEHLVCFSLVVCSPRDKSH